MAEATPHEYVTPYIFEVEGGGISVLHFSRVTGLGGEIGVKEWRQVNDPGTPIKLPTEMVFDDITLERGVDTDGTLAKWWTEVADSVASGASSFQRYSLIVTAYGRNRNIQARWQVSGAWPRKVKWGDLDASTSGMFIESLVIASEGVKRL